MITLTLEDLIYLETIAELADRESKELLNDLLEESQGIA